MKWSEMGKLKVDGELSNSWKRWKNNKLYITHKTRNSGLIGDLTAIAKRIILKEHATNKTNLHELLPEPKINKYIKSHICNQSKQRGILEQTYSKKL